MDTSFMLLSLSTFKHKIRAKVLWFILDLLNEFTNTSYHSFIPVNTILYCYLISLHFILLEYLSLFIAPFRRLLNKRTRYQYVKKKQTNCVAHITI